MTASTKTPANAVPTPGSPVFAAIHRRRSCGACTTGWATTWPGWHTAARVGEVSVLASTGVLQGVGVIAHLLAPFISACVTPLTVIAVMLAYHWQLGLAALVAAARAAGRRTASACWTTPSPTCSAPRAAHSCPRCPASWR
ncbi:hypothetical protein GCM10010171_59590 [Actinokineospora fastidiosa]|uniref:ABC transmembrane type-1 domain-containing protein n=1 Tax=Actinokineospora fastidiosa TaxID=1816 RepID=A0A918LJH8_9PSEU|nr:hypothetical protein GCM10010171_59590 [Actinokineospora fastidiosa]